MANTRTARGYQNTTNIAQVLKNKLERNKATHIIKPDGSYLISYKGAILTPEAFNEMLPVDVHNVSVKGVGCSAHQKMVA